MTNFAESLSKQILTIMEEDELKAEKSDKSEKLENEIKTYLDMHIKVEQYISSLYSYLTLIDEQEKALSKKL